MCSHKFHEIFWHVLQPAKEVKMEKRMKTVSKSIDLAVTSRSVPIVPEVSALVFFPLLTVLFFWSNILAAR
jgi:hypothetical protein